MILSPLFLKHYFIANLSVKANPDFASFTDAKQFQHAIETAEGNLGAEVEIAKNPENDRDWKVGLKIHHASSGEKFCAYFIDIELVGFFEMHSSVPSEKVPALVAANAPALLFSAARELVMLITGRGPLPPLCLPSVTFVDAVPPEQPAPSRLSKKELTLHSKR